MQRDHRARWYDRFFVWLAPLSSLHDRVAPRMVKMGKVRCWCLFNILSHKWMKSCFRSPPTSMRWRWPLPGLCGCQVHEETEETPPPSDWVAALRWDWPRMLKWAWFGRCNEVQWRHEQVLACHNSMMIISCADFSLRLSMYARCPVSADFQCTIGGTWC